MYFDAEHLQADYRPRLIIWQLTSGDSSQELSTHECLLVIDSIARTAKPIVVLVGNNLLQRCELYEIVEYGNALGLKMIIEAYPHELTQEVLQQYSRFGSKIFRVVLDGCIVEDMDTRFKHSKQFLLLEDTIRRLKDNGYEIHFGVTVAVANTNLRELAFEHDYAIRRSANGLYCHLRYQPSEKKSKKRGLSGLHEVIEAIAKMKKFSPKNMYVSPQCVRYGIRQEEVDDNHNGRQAEKANGEWMHWCLAGKTFAFITADGKVQLCIGLPLLCGDLCSNGYDFQKIWESSDVFNHLREQGLSCNETRSEINNGVENPQLFEKDV